MRVGKRGDVAMDQIVIIEEHHMIGTVGLSSQW
jgi:hypothetical protein